MELGRPGTDRPPAGSLRLTLLGDAALTLGGAPLSGFVTSKAPALLCYLAVTGRSHSREALAALLWGDLPEEAARNNLRQALTNLRRLVEFHLIIARDTVAFNPDAPHWLDVAHFDAHLRDAAEDPREAAEHLRAAVDLYGGDFLDGLAVRAAPGFEEWVTRERERLRRRALQALHDLAVHHTDRAEYTAATQALTRLLALDPWREDAHRQLMRLLAASGQRDAALAQYDACRRLLAAEVGAEPDEETRALHDEIRADALAPASPVATPPPHTLPPDVTPFVGREPELKRIAALRMAPGTRLLTLVGAGGMGKTRLAVEAARPGLDAFPDGVFFVPLAPLVEASALAPAIAEAVGVPVHGGEARPALLRAFHDRCLLLILDGFEHLLAGAEFVAELLGAAPRLEIIATSREPLNLRGEQRYYVGGMDAGSQGTGGAAAASPAVRLFVQAARRVDPDFALGEADLPAVLRVCALVGRMPLGLELAAAWAGRLSPAAIATEIERSADFLAVEWRDLPARQRSMRAVFDWSWQLLGDAERQALCRLAVFRHGFTPDAARVVAGAPLGLLTTLAHKSLLQWGEASGVGAGRYEIHGLLRQFAAEQLDAVPGERAAVEARHRAYFLEAVVERERRTARDEPRQAVEDVRGAPGDRRRA